MTWCLQLGNKYLLLLAKEDCCILCVNTDMIWWNDPSSPSPLLNLWGETGSFVAVPPHAVGKSSSKDNYVERRRCPQGVTPINAAILRVWIVFSLWREQKKKLSLKICCLSSPVLFQESRLPATVSVCQHFLSSCSMHWYFKASVGPSRWEALACFSASQLKSEVFVFRQHMSLIWPSKPLRSFSSGTISCSSGTSEKPQVVLFCIALAWCSDCLLRVFLTQLSRARLYSSVYLCKHRRTLSQTGANTNKNYCLHLKDTPPRGSFPNLGSELLL